MDFIETLERIPNIRMLETPGVYLKQRLASQADKLSNAAHIQASIEVANECLCRLASICYETLDRQPVNVDARTFRLLIPMPWGDAGYKAWGLRANEARILRAVLMARAQSQDALFDYADRQWFLNAHTYKSPKSALEYLKSNPVNGREWLRFCGDYRTQDAQRKNEERTQNLRKR